MVLDHVAQAVAGLRLSGVELDRGLSDHEVSRIEEHHAFRFGAEHRALLQLVVPVGRSWPDWRHGDEAELRRRLDWPVEGVLFDVHEGAFWPASWGARPPDDDTRERVARAHLEEVPRLVPLFSHRYLTVDDSYVPSPVFSVHQSDVIYYGDDLVDYIAREFKVTAPRPSPDRPRVPFWSDLASGAQDRDL